MSTEDRADAAADIAAANGRSPRARRDETPDIGNSARDVTADYEYGIRTAAVASDDATPIHPADYEASYWASVARPSVKPSRQWTRRHGIDHSWTDRRPQ